jgi:hypothetical protein
MKDPEQIKKYLMEQFALGFNTVVLQAKQENVLPLPIIAKVIDLGSGGVQVNFKPRIKTK